jgi:four helix bundle protein
MSVKYKAIRKEGDSQTAAGTSLPYVRSHRELVVYQHQRQLAGDIFMITRRFPKEEMYSLTDQVRRSSRSIGAHIAEAWALRDYERHFLSKLAGADSEQLETQHWIDTAMDCEYLTRQEADTLLIQCQGLGRMLGSMIDKAHHFCTGNTAIVREDSNEFFTDSPPH